MTPQEDTRVLLALVDRHPPFTHMLNVLAQLAGVDLDPELLELQPDAVEARYEEGPFPLPASRMGIMAAIEQLRDEAVRGIGED
jgi:hypothetical protein